MDYQTLANKWLQSAIRMQYLHFEAANYYETLNKELGIPTLVLSVVVGTSAFTNASGSIAALPTPWQYAIKGLILIVGVSSAVMTGMQTFLKFGDTAEKHRRAAKSFTGLRMDIEMLIADTSQQTAQVVGMRLEEIKKAYSTFANEAPEIPNKLWSRGGLSTRDAISNAMKPEDVSHTDNVATAASLRK